MKTFFYDGNKNINRNSDPNLRNDGVFGDSEESLDSQVLFEPAEEELDLPAGLIEFCHSESGKLKVVR